MSSEMVDKNPAVRPKGVQGRWEYRKMFSLDELDGIRTAMASDGWDYVKTVRHPYPSPGHPALEAEFWKPLRVPSTARRREE